MSKELVDEIDALVGRDGRTAFLVETAQAELDRRRLNRLVAGDDSRQRVQQSDPPLDIAVTRMGNAIYLR